MFVVVRRLALFQADLSMIENDVNVQLTFAIGVLYCLWLHAVLEC